MLSEILSSVSGVASYPIFGLVIFVALFLGVLWTIYRMDGQHCRRMAELPLDPMPEISQIKSNAIETDNE